MPFLQYAVTGETLCLGERTKGGLFRPCDRRAMRYSAVTGALRSYVGGSSIHAAGYFEHRAGCNQVEYLTYGPRNQATGVAVLPLTVQYLANVAGVVVVKADDHTLPDSFDIVMGALKAQGFGRCRFQLTGAADMTPTWGRLRSRIPVAVQSEFEIASVQDAVYGYLFEPTSATAGRYVLALMEDSHVVGPACLVEEEHQWTTR